MLVCISKCYKPLENYNGEIEVKGMNGRNLSSRPRIHEKKTIQCIIDRTKNRERYPG